MPTIEIALRDDAGQIVDCRSVKKYPLDWETQSFHDIEGAVENFKRSALPDIEADWLEAAQNALTAGKKKTRLATARFRSRLKHFTGDLNSGCSGLPTGRTRTRRTRPTLMGRVNFKTVISVIG